MDWLILGLILLILALIILILARLNQGMTPGGKGGVVGAGDDPFKDWYLRLDPPPTYSNGRLSGTNRRGYQVSWTKQEWCDGIKKQIENLKASGQGAGEGDTLQKNMDEVQRLLNIVC
jgi:hypothetical protein